MAFVLLRFYFPEDSNKCSFLCREEVIIVHNLAKSLFAATIKHLGYMVREIFLKTFTAKDADGFTRYFDDLHVLLANISKCIKQQTIAVIKS